MAHSTAPLVYRLTVDPTARTPDVWICGEFSQCRAADGGWGRLRCAHHAQWCVCRAISAIRIHARTYLQAYLPAHTRLFFVFSVLDAANGGFVPSQTWTCSPNSLWTLRITSPGLQKRDLTYCGNLPGFFSLFFCKTRWNCGSDFPVIALAQVILQKDAAVLRNF